MKIWIWIVAAVFSHRALYAAAAAVYGAAAVGAEKAVVAGLLVVVYVALAWKG